MDYTQIILDSVEDKKLLHQITDSLKKEYLSLAKAVSAGNSELCGVIVGKMELDVNLLIALDKKVNEIKPSVNVA